MTKPTVGRIVHYYQAENEDKLHNNTRGPHPAIVNAVWSETCVNLTVLFDCGPVECRTSQTLRTDDADHNPNPYWVWPPRG